MADPHFGFVAAAYAIAAIVILWMIGSVVLDYRRLSATLDRATRTLEAARGAKGGRG
jgi:heme exporter protein CcmD